jgi:hypothetical protein
VKLRQILFIYQNIIRDLAAALRVNAKKAAQNERNITVLIKQLGEISGIMVTIIRIEVDLCIFCKGKRNRI